MNILIAPNAFKGALSADDAADAIERGLRASPLDCTTILHPIGDGGDGTAALLVRHLGAQTIIASTVDPIGRPITAKFGITPDGKTAIIGMSDASGLHLLSDDERDPLNATSFGTGILVGQALDAGVTEILLCVGGSATIDGGTGIARALGVRFLDGRGGELLPRPAALTDLAAVETADLHKRTRDCKITILCDVDNTLLGREGAARIYGPQKGAKPSDVELLEGGLRRLAVVLLQKSKTNIGDLAGGGAAGGAAAALHALVGAKLVPGSSHFLSVSGFDQKLADAQLVITGEGAIDEQTMFAKAPQEVASRAKAIGLGVIALAGQVPLKSSPSLRACFDMALAIGDRPASLQEAIVHTARNLERCAFDIGALLHSVAISRPSPDHSKG